VASKGSAPNDWDLVGAPRYVGRTRPVPGPGCVGWPGIVLGGMPGAGGLLCEKDAEFFTPEREFCGVAVAEVGAALDRADAELLLPVIEALVVDGRILLVMLFDTELIFCCVKLLLNAVVVFSRIDPLFSGIGLIFDCKGAFGSWL